MCLLLFSGTLLLHSHNRHRSNRHLTCLCADPCPAVVPTGSHPHVYGKAGPIHSYISAVAQEEFAREVLWQAGSQGPPISYLEGSVTISGKGKNPLVLGPAQCHSLPSSSHSQPQSWFSDHDFIRLPCTCTHRHQGPRPLISPHPTPIDHLVYKAKITFVFLWVPCNGNLLPPSTDIRSCMWMAPG